MITFFIKIATKLINLLSHRLLVVFGKCFGSVLYLISGKRRKITLENITASFPEKSLDEIKSIAKKSYQNFAITIFEFIHFNSWDKKDIQNLIKLENFELVEEIYSRGNGILLMTGHYGNWELLACATGILAKEKLNLGLNVVMKNQKNLYFDRYINNNREKYGNKTIPSGVAGREMMKLVLRKEIVAVIVDQAADPHKDVFVEFFSRLAATFEAPATLCLKYKIPMVVAYAVRNTDNTYSARFEEIKHSDLEYNKDGVKELTQRHVKHIENQIREKPEIWSWQHNRWKH